MEQNPARVTAEAVHPTAVGDLYRQICEPEYWRQMNPELTVSDVLGRSPGQDAVRLRREELVEVVENLRREGYFQIDDAIPLRLVEHMNEAVRRMHQFKCPPVFAFVYDEFWTACAKLAGVQGAALGEPYWQLPDFWVWFVDPTIEASGWRPHRDKGFGSLLPDGSPKSITLWIPLTDATPLNGCIYVVPLHWDSPSIQAGQESSHQPKNLQDVRALPVRAGTVLGWNQAILHWGGRASRRAKQPRISFACEFQRGDVPAFNTPLLDPLQPPPFNVRLSLIGKQILQYRHMYGLPENIAVLAQRLVEST